MTSSNVDSAEQKRIVASALWAAYGDAVGFPTELATPELVKKRLGSKEAVGLKSWSRSVGGRFGVIARLPSGAYSDDTQLRLATCRAIRGDGFFDVEAFANIELPIWLSYALGAGRGSKKAAASLGSKSTTWFSNLYSGPGGEYVNGGGNGAAMRIQPHVWACSNLRDPLAYLPDVVRNSVCTHGHVRGIGGAMIHAAALADVLRTGKLASPSEWREYSKVLRLFPKIVSDDSDLSTFWLGAWEEQSGFSLVQAVDETVGEWESAVETVCQLVGRGEVRHDYAEIVHALGGLTDAERGSGLKSALFAIVSSWLFREVDIDVALRYVVNLLWSDTDTIATMAGALLGARLDESLPSDPVQDTSYIKHEACRMHDISVGREVMTFGYPDLLYWSFPKSNLDAVGVSESVLMIAGLGLLEPIGSSYVANGTKDTVWQWFELPFGQTILAKHRSKPRHLAVSQLPVNSTLRRREVTKSVTRNNREPQKELFNEAREVELSSRIALRPRSLDELTSEAIRSAFDPMLIGKQILDFSEQPMAIEKAISYVSVVLKACLARKDAGKAKAATKGDGGN